jgi:hypothetical protein
VTLRTGLLACGVVSSLVYVALNILGALLYPGYSLASHTISELYAIGAPPRVLVAALMVVYNLLLYAFGVGVWQSAGQSAGRKLALRVAAAGMIGKEVLGMAVTLFFPMHTRQVLAAGGATLTDEMHKDLTIAGTLFMLGAMVAGATAFGKRFRIYTIATIVLFVVGGVAAFGDATRMAANLPTPWQGVKERANAFGYMLWLAVLAVTLLRGRAARPNAVPAGAPTPDARSRRTVQPGAPGHPGRGASVGGAPRRRGRGRRLVAPLAGGSGCGAGGRAGR